MTLQSSFKTQMKIDVAPLQHLMKGFYLVQDNIHTKTWCSDDINDHKIEHVMHKCLDSYPWIGNLEFTHMLV